MANYRAKRTSILQMCDIYLRMDTYFDECLKSDNRIEELIRGESSCFDQTLITNDEVFDSLVQPWENDNIVKSMMVHTLGALKQLIGRVNKDYLPQGITFEKARRATNRSLKMTIWSLASDLCYEEKISVRGRHYNTIRQGTPFHHCLSGRRHFNTTTRSLPLCGYGPGL